MLRRKTRHFLSLVLILFFQSVLYGQNKSNKDVLKTNWDISAEWLNYQSFSQQKTSMRMKAAYPSYVSKILAFNSTYKIEKAKSIQEINFSLSLPSSIDSDDGSGTNYLLDKKQSRYFRSELNYRKSFSLLKWNRFNIKHAFISGLLYESRNLHFLSNSVEKTKDINLYIGPALQMQYDLSESFALKAYFDASFYLPYLNYGVLEAADASDNTFFTSVYRAFYYETIFKMELAYLLPNLNSIILGIAKDDLVGFANRKPLFYIDDVVHFKFDRLYHFSLKYQFYSKNR